METAPIPKSDPKAGSTDHRKTMSTPICFGTRTSGVSLGHCTSSIDARPTHHTGGPNARNNDARKRSKTRNAAADADAVNTLPVGSILTWNTHGLNGTKLLAAVTSKLRI